MKVVAPESSPDVSDELINQISSLQLNDLNDQATLSEESKLEEAQVNERGHDRNQPRVRSNCPYTRNLSVRSSSCESLSSSPITCEPTREQLLLSGGGRIEIPSLTQSKIANDGFTYQNLNLPIHGSPKASDEEYVYRKIHEIICENEEINPIPFDELSNPNLPEEAIDLILENETKIENVPSTSPASCSPETCNNFPQIGTNTTGIVYVQMYRPSPPVVIQNKKPLKIFPKVGPESPVQNQIPVPLPCKKPCTMEDKYHKKFLKINLEVGLGKRDDLNRTVLHTLIMKKSDKFAVYLVTKIKNCFQRGHAANLKGIQSVSSFINSCDSSGQTPLYYAALFNQLKITECLLSFGADPNVAETQEGNSPLHAASQRGKRYLEVIKLLCQCSSIQMNICNKTGKSALHIAVQSHGIIHEDSSENICEEIDSGPVIEHLLRNKASLTTQDQDGKTPLHLAVERCQPDLIRILEANANDWKEAVNMMDKKGSTVLHIAAVLKTEKEMQKSIIMDLLSRNAEPTKDSKGRLPAELVSPERKDIAELLKRVWSQECMQYIHI